MNKNPKQTQGGVLQTFCSFGSLKKDSEVHSVALVRQNFCYAKNTYGRSAPPKPFWSLKQVLVAIFENAYKLELNKEIGNNIFSPPSDRGNVRRFFFQKNR